MTIKKRETYSFSKLSSFAQCPYGWYLNYIQHQKGIDNFFSLYGSFCHELCQKYADGEYELDALPALYEWGFEDAVPLPAPPNKYVDLRQSYYDSGLAFFQDWEGYGSCRILGVETKFTIPITDFDLTGFIDISFVDENGRYILRDYKSSKTISKTDLAHKIRQPYLYSLYYKQVYGRYPDALQFYTFRNPKKRIVEVPFREEEMENAVQWAVDTVAQIRQEWAFEKQPDDWFCHQLCGQRERCPCGQTKGVA